MVGLCLSDYSSNARLYFKYLVSNISHGTRLSRASRSRYFGVVKDKSILFNSKGCLSIENMLWPTGYSTEKLIEPLIYGSIPIYLGSNSSGDYLHMLDPELRNYLTHSDSASLLRSCLQVSELTLSDAQEISSSIDRL